MTPRSDVPAPFIDTPVSLRRSLDVLRNRYMSMVLTTAAAAIIMAFIARSERPAYTATARLLVDPVNYTIQQLDSSNPLSNIIAAGAEHSVGTQAHIINSGSFLEDVYRSLGINANQVKGI